MMVEKRRALFAIKKELDVHKDMVLIEKNQVKTVIDLT